MHIVILADPIDNQKAGIHVYTKNLIANLLKLNKKNRYTFIHERENAFFNGHENYIIPKKKSPLYGTYRKFYLIPKLIKKLNPDLVFEPCHIGPFNLPPHIKRAVMIHDLSPILYPQFHIKRSTIIHKLLLKSVLKNSDLVLTASETTKNDILSYQKPKGKISVIPLGIDPPLKTTIQKPTPPYLLYLGTIEPRKNLITVIDAFNELNLPHNLILAGEIGWKADDILKKAKSNSKIILTSYINEEKKAELYANADLFIYPSVYEGFGLPPLEAMSYGTPVISSNGGSLKEILQNHATLFDPHDKNQLKSTILRLLTNRPDTTNAKSFSQNFTWQKTAEKTLNAFNSLF